MPALPFHNEPRATTNAQLEHYMKQAGVRPVDSEAKWATTWPELIRERVAYYCVTRVMISAKLAPPEDLPPKPKVIK